MKRRELVKSGLMTALYPIAKFDIDSFNNFSEFGSIKFGVCSDLHHDLIFDAPMRLNAFIDDMIEKKADFIIQLGDFCEPIAKNKIIMDIWDRFEGQKHHVIGNHDLELNRYSRDQLMNFWNSVAPYYSFDLKGFHFVILDGNEYYSKHEKLNEYYRFISEEQRQWLESDLDKTNLPVFVFIHAGLDNDLAGIAESVRIRHIFELANDKAGFRKVQMVFSGDQHNDYHNVINGIHYIQINSMSNHYHDKKYVSNDFPEELVKEYPNLDWMAYYKEPLWAYIEITKTGHLKLFGKKTQFVGKTPEECGMPPYLYIYPVVPFISNRSIRLTLRPFQDNKSEV